MTEAIKLTWCRRFLRALSLVTLVAFSSWIGLILLQAPIVAPGSILAPLLRFRPYNPSYESMISAVYIVWALALWRASDDPGKHLLFIDFSIWSNTAHGLVMLIATPLQKSFVMWMIEGLPLLAIAAVLRWLRPAPDNQSTSATASASRHPFGGQRFKVRTGVTPISYLDL